MCQSPVFVSPSITYLDHWAMFVFVCVFGKWELSQHINNKLKINLQYLRNHHVYVCIYVCIHTLYIHFVCAYGSFSPLLMCVLIPMRVLKKKLWLILWITSGLHFTQCSGSNNTMGHAYIHIYIYRHKHSYSTLYSPLGTFSVASTVPLFMPLKYCRSTPL